MTARRRLSKQLSLWQDPLPAPAEPAGPAPQVGMGTTQLLWTDRHSWTIIRVLGPKRIEVQRDNQDLTPNPSGECKILTLRHRGNWSPPGSGKGEVFVLGSRDEFHDPGF